MSRISSGKPRELCGPEINLTLRWNIRFYKASFMGVIYIISFAIRSYYYGETILTEKEEICNKIDIGRNNVKIIINI